MKASNIQKIALGLLLDLAETGLIMEPQVTDRRWLPSDPPSHWVGQVQVGLVHTSSLTIRHEHVQRKQLNHRSWQPSPPCFLTC